MTDVPAVVYLKAKNSATNVDTTWRENKVSDCGNGRKSVRNHKYSNRSRKRIESYKKLLGSLNNVILKKMDKIEGRLDMLSDNCNTLEEKVNILSSYFDSNSYSIHEAPMQFSDFRIRSKVTQIVLNTAGDYPRGSWLGFENKPEMRVRCKISPKNLLEINRKCVTPAKMALTLLDHLFDRETQACSNISGLGKHRKKQLDPLLIFGIRCHLMYRFDITEEDWTKIKIHMDSKCRSAFRRKLKGMPIKLKKVIKTKSGSSDCLDVVSCEFSNSSNMSSDQGMIAENIPF